VAHAAPFRGSAGMTCSLRASDACTILRESRRYSNTTWMVGGAIVVAASVIAVAARPARGNARRRVTERGSWAMLRQHEHSDAALKGNDVAGNDTGARDGALSAGERERVILDVPEAGVGLRLCPYVAAIVDTDADIERVGPVLAQDERAGNEPHAVRADLERGER
jgi:hypothetical protein